jgi:hypothetical protein
VLFFGGDTVGRDRNSRDLGECVAAERFMVDAHASWSIEADVLIAPHHGANNGSSSAFIATVDPSDVIFSAGRGHEHPRAFTALRYYSEGLTEFGMWRTDFGDKETPFAMAYGPLDLHAEWSFGRTEGGTGKDRRDDDHINIVVDPGGNQYAVGYAR